MVGTLTVCCDWLYYLCVVIYMFAIITFRLGFFYCPYLPLITIATLLLHFYVRRVRKIVKGHLSQVML